MTTNHVNSGTPAGVLQPTPERKGRCPCMHTTPCDPRCSCVMSSSSRGCRRCCAYGSPDQQRARAEHIVAAEAERDKLAKFKTFVHSYLDQHGVPEDDPTNQHSIEGCRIGARLDLLLAERDAAKALAFNVEKERHALALVADAARSERDKLKNELLGVQKANVLLNKGMESQQVRGADRLKYVGAAMANACYNLGQPAHSLTDRDREVLRDLCEQWDAATRVERRVDGGTRSDFNKELPTDPRT